MFSSVSVPAHFNISSIHLHSLKPCSYSISCPVILPTPSQFTTDPQPLISSHHILQHFSTSSLHPSQLLPWNLNVLPHLVITPLSFLNTLLSLPHPPFILQSTIISLFCYSVRPLHSTVSSQSKFCQRPHKKSPAVTETAPAHRANRPPDRMLYCFFSFIDAFSSTKQHLRKSQRTTPVSLWFWSHIGRNMVSWRRSHSRCAASVSQYD